MKEMLEIRGGVAILCHERVRCKHLDDYNVNGLEAIWAEVMINSVRFVIGSVYIPPYKDDDLKRFQLVLKRVMKDHKKVLVCMDANSRNAVWDNSCIGLDPNVRSMKRGEHLLEMFEAAPVHIHNDGSTTFFGSRGISTPDITVSSGIIESKPVYSHRNWEVEMQSL